jgi:CAAX prenyl protease-like protein
MKQTDSTPAPIAQPANAPPATDVPMTVFHGRRNPWLVFLLPFVVYMLIGSFEPGPAAANDAKSASWLDLGIEYRHYALVYSIKILFTVAAMIYVLPGYRQISCRSPRPPEKPEALARETGRYPSLALRASVENGYALAVFVGLLGAIAWIALASAQRYAQERLGWSPGLGARTAFNPLKELAAAPAWAYAFLAIRFLGLALVVPVIEECFLRGFVMRYVVAADWWRIPIGTVTRVAVITGTALPVLMHPNEALAAAVWFSAVTWLAARTKNLWSCVAAHGTTNLFLGIYVLATGNWWLM